MKKIIILLFVSLTLLSSCKKDITEEKENKKIDNNENIIINNTGEAQKMGVSGIGVKGSSIREVALEEDREISSDYDNIIEYNDTSGVKEQF